MEDRRRAAPWSRRATRGAALFALLLGLAVLLAPAADALGVGDRVPPLALPTAAGGAFALQAELGERPVLLAFVSPRCTPCRESKPALEQLCQTYGTDRRLAVVSVMLGGASAEARSGAEPSHSTSCTETLVLGDEAVAASYGVFGTPVYLLVGRQGTVLWKHVGRLAPGQVEVALGSELAVLEPTPP